MDTASGVAAAAGAGGGGGVGPVMSTVMSSIYTLNQPFDGLSTLLSFNDIIKDYTTNQKVPGCAGRVRFNGDCVIDKKIQPIYDLCPANCDYNIEEAMCACTRAGSGIWTCPEGTGEGPDNPMDFAVTMLKGEMDVVPISSDDEYKRNRKSSKVVKLCLRFDIGMSEPVCPESHPFNEGERCYRHVTDTPRISCTKLATSASDPDITVDEISYDCHKNINWRDRQVLDCVCEYMELRPPWFRCPEPFSRRDGEGDYYSHNEMQDLKILMNIDEFPMKLCHAKEYLPVSCIQAHSQDTSDTDLTFAHVTKGIWEDRGSSCIRDLWYPPIELYCPNRIDFLDDTSTLFGFRGSCVRDVIDSGEGRCLMSGEVDFNEDNQTCTKVEYVPVIGRSCDSFFSISKTAWDITPIVKKEVDGETCVVTRYVPAEHYCENKDCKEIYYKTPKPRCVKGRLDRTEGEAQCIVRTIEKAGAIKQGEYDL